MEHAQFLPLSLGGAPRVPLFLYVNVGPARFADQVKERGAVVGQPWKDVPMIVFPYNGQTKE
eukprot:8191727-Pyramimonas_sp.AAC.1